MSHPPPTRRRGPRPIALHLGLASGRAWTALLATTRLTATPPPPPPSPSSTSGSPSWSGGWPSSSAGRAELERIAHALAAGGHRPEAFRAAVLRALLRRDRALLAGVVAYRRHPWRRELPDPPAVWEEGGSRLLDYATARGGPRVLFVPSLINRAHVLDLLPEASLLRFLAASGVRPLLLDWGWPGEVERGFTLTDYVAGRLERALAAAVREAGAGRPILLAGYCMGGLLALAAAQRRPDLVRGLALLATPWDFWAGEGEEDGGADRAQVLAGLLTGLEPVLEATGTLPVDVLQMLFVALDPFGVAEKYRGFARLDPVGARARRFVALEDWLNDGVPLAAPVARECLARWYGANTPALGAWRIAGLPVDPAAWRGPSFLAIPSRDRIVPPDSASALAGRLGGQVLAHRPAAGHIGMVAGTGAEAALWRPLLRWVKTT
jgi:polyhydroxyalkanoate synthase subunit PhaC